MTTVRFEFHFNHTGILMPIQTGKMKACEIECRSCGISETMVFRKTGVRWRHVPMIGDEENAFKPERAIFGDNPPATCPKCKGELKASDIQVVC